VKEPVHMKPSEFELGSGHNPSDCSMMDAASIRNNAFWAYVYLGMMYLHKKALK